MVSNDLTAEALAIRARRHRVLHSMPDWNPTRGPEP